MQDARVAAMGGDKANVSARVSTASVHEVFNARQHRQSDARQRRHNNARPSTKECAPLPRPWHGSSLEAMNTDDSDLRDFRVAFKKQRGRVKR
jgi:hypothetical protein